LGAKGSQKGSTSTFLSKKTRKPKESRKTQKRRITDIGGVWHGGKTAKVLL